MYVKIIFAKTFCVEIIFFDKHIENITSAGQEPVSLYRPPFSSPSLINAATI